MTTIKDIVMDIISTYGVIDTDAIAATRGKDELWWGKEVMSTLWELFAVESSIIHLWRDDFDHFAVTWIEGDEISMILVKVIEKTCLR